MNLEDALDRIKKGRTLSVNESEAVFTEIIESTTPHNLLPEFLILLSKRGEAVEEVIGAVQAIRKNMDLFPDDQDNAIDVCGTGGDKKGTLNVSTAVAFVCAGAGVRVIKHGNRAISSKSGSSDILQELGINVAAPKPVMQRALAETNVCFLHAPLYHRALKNVASTRANIRQRTIFNILGPLLNPAKVKRQLVGVYDQQWCEPFAKILQQLGSTHAIIAHGEDGLDEFTTTTTTYYTELVDDVVHPIISKDSQSILDVEHDKDDQLLGGLPADNAKALLTVLKDDTHGAYRNIILLNTAMALVVADKVTEPRDGVELAKESLASGAAYNVLQKLRTITQASA